MITSTSKRVDYRRKGGGDNIYIYMLYSITK